MWLFNLFVLQYLKIAYFYNNCYDSNKIPLALISSKMINLTLLFAVLILY